MTLVKVRAALEEAINTEMKDTDPTVSVIFDNLPFTTPGKTKKYVLVSIDFTQATQQPQGAAISFYGGTIRCGILTPKNKGTYEAAAISEALITALTSVNASDYTDTYSVSPRTSRITGPSSINNENDSHYLAVISCDFTANA